MVGIMVKIQGANISPSVNSQVSSELVLVLRNPLSTQVAVPSGQLFRERFPMVEK